MRLPLVPASAGSRGQGPPRRMVHAGLVELSRVEPMAQKARASGKLVAENRNARFNYEIEDTLEAGIVLTGSEVKSLRAGKANIADAYASDEGGGALYLINAHIAEYAQSGPPTTSRRGRASFCCISASSTGCRARSSGEGMTVVPLKLYFNQRGLRQGRCSASPRARSCTTSARPRRSAIGTGRRAA